MTAAEVSVEDLSAGTKGKPRLPSLTGLRFIAAFLVVINHVGMTTVPRFAPEASLAGGFYYGAGALGVSFFFILSGFVLTWVSRANDSAGLFWRRRAAKVLPNSVVTWVAATLLALVTGAGVAWGHALPTLFLVQSWIPNQHILLDLRLNTPTWSLACELLFYLCFPLVARWVRKIPAHRLWAWTIGIVLAILAMPQLARLLPDQELIHDVAGPWLPGWSTMFFPPVRMLEFVLGILMAHIVLRGRWTGFGLGKAISLTAAAYVLTVFVGEYTGQVAVTALPLALLVAAAATADVRKGRTVFGGRKMVFLGEISFSLYVVHWLVIAYGPLDGANPDLWSIPETVPHLAVAAVLSVGIALVLAVGLYLGVEKPLMRRWSRPARASDRDMHDATPASPARTDDGQPRQ
ncbi:acyltransferase [Amycolatopsis sp. OK19-0408]|uniref:Acyltransferase n=1 Tax=Amycolatopsis iheyensis TaxID=2945988 RepID=A0A9X2SP74_9PSEU|nr:acyltransferase [Amycolatopsis iheyensis]MCR6488678.1 acyltransferase [Amycolatopsis iheyensis]